MSSILVAVKGAATQACSPGGSYQSPNTGISRGLTLCDVVVSSSSTCRHIGGGGGCYGSLASFSSSRQRHSPTVESVVFPDRFKVRRSSSSPSSSLSHSNLGISCHLATTEREFAKNDKSSSAAATVELKLLTPKDEDKSEPPSPSAPLSRFSHFLREFARQHVVWAAWLLDPFQDAGENSNDVNQFIQQLKLRIHPLSSTPPSSLSSSGNLDTSTISDMVLPTAESASQTGTTATTITDEVAGMAKEQSIPQVLGLTTVGAAVPDLLSYATEAAMGTAVGAGSYASVMRNSGNTGLSIESSSSNPSTSAFSSSTSMTDLSTGRKRESTGIPRAATAAAAAVVFVGPSLDVATATTTEALPQAELDHRSARCVTAADIGSVDNLARWLEERIKHSKLRQWGVAPGTKQVSNLWCELVEGEILLEDSVPPKRSTHVSSVKIRDGAGHVLVESHQEMADGRKRSRNRPLSEKMRPGERVEEACLRGIFEELGCELGARERVMMVPQSYRREEEERDSFSYPGLPTRYVIHSMAAHIQQLPTVEFFTEEDESGHGGTAEGVAALNGSSGSQKRAVGVKRHFWRWVPENLLGQLCQKT